MADPWDLRPPAFHSAPAYEHTFGPEVAAICDQIGFAPDPEQRLLLDDAFAVTDVGANVAFEVAAIATRQQLKALAVDTPLWTERGWSSMADVVVGDRVATPSGGWTSVLGKSEVRSGHQCYRVSTTDGRSVVADAGHLWTVMDRRLGRNGKLVTLTTQEIVDRGLYRTVGAATRLVTLKGKSYQTREYRFGLPAQAAVEGVETDLPLDPYLFGVWLGDGHSTGSEISVGDEDLDHMVEQVAAAGYEPRIRRDRTCWSVSPFADRVRSRAVSSHLRRMGVLGNKHIPDSYLTAALSQRQALLQGLMDTDGTISIAGQATFYTIRWQLAESVLLLVRSLGWRATLTSWRAKLHGVDQGDVFAVKFTPKTGDPAAPFRLARKASRIGTDGRVGRNSVSISSVEAVESVPVQCIRVDAKDGLFLAGRDLMVTHNTGFMKQYAIGRLFVTQEELVTWSAHLFSTTEEAFRDLSGLMSASAMLRKRLAPGPTNGIHAGRGSEHIELRDGRRIMFKSRTKTGGRGLTGDIIILDEALFLAAEHMGSLIPTLTAVPDPQIVYGSSAGLALSVILRGIRDRGRAGSPGLAYGEWCAPQRQCGTDGCEHRPPSAPLYQPGCALDDEELWAEASPLLGRSRPNGTGLTLAKMRRFREAEPAEEWIRERLGWWDEPGVVQVFGPGRWDACLAEAPRGLPVGALTLAVEHDLSRAAVGAATLADGRVIIRPLGHGFGIQWTVEELKKHQARHRVPVLYSEKGPAATLVPELRSAGLWLRPVKSDEEFDAFDTFFELVKSGGLSHEGYPELNDEINGAVPRYLGDRRKWGRRSSSAQISVVEAVTLAAWWVKRPQPVLSPPPPPAMAAVSTVNEMDSIGF